MPFSRFTDERGIALPVALSVLFVVAGLATVAARTGIVSNNQSFRDKNAKRAMQAANAGLQAAVYQVNKLQPSSAQCVYRDASAGALTKGALVSGWCPGQTEDLGDTATYNLQVSGPTQALSSTGVDVDQRTVVSTGTVNGVLRRVTMKMNASRGNPLFPPNYAVAVRDSVSMKNNADIVGNLGSNGTITVKNNLNVCGNVTPGPGKTAKIGHNLTQCPGYNVAAATEPFDLQPIDLTGPKAANDNARLTNMKHGSGTQDTCTACNKILWDATTRVLAMDGGTLTLAGNVYLFCRFEFTKGTIQVASRTTPLYIYLDTPENCGGTTGMGSAIMDGTFTNLYTPPHPIAIMVAGSPTVATSVDLPTNDASTPIGVYAPNSTVVQKNGVIFTGAVVSKTLDVKNNALFTYHSSIGEIQSGSTIRFYQAGTGSYKECSGASTTSVPTQGC